VLTALTQCVHSSAPHSGLPVQGSDLVLNGSARFRVTPNPGPDQWSSSAAAPEPRTRPWSGPERFRFGTKVQNRTAATLPRMGRHIPILYSSSRRFGIITSLYTEAPVLLQLHSLKTPLITTMSSANHRCIHYATSPAIAQMIFMTCQLRGPLLLPLLHLPPGSHDSVLMDDITTHPTTSYHYIDFLSRSSHLTTLTGRCLDSMLCPTIIRKTLPR
jgi:hypothetical protein